MENRENPERSEGPEILVCVKQVPDSGEVPVEPGTYTLDRKRARMVVNPADECGFELALRLQEHYGGHVTLLSMGRPEAAKMLRSLSAVGGDAFYLASDPAFAGADTHGTAQVLRRCVDFLGGFDLILCGERSIDGETGQVAPSLAAMLGWKFAGYVTGISLLPGGLAEACQSGQMGAGSKEKRFQPFELSACQSMQMGIKMEYSLPLVASVRRCCILRYPSLQGLRWAGHTRVTVLDAKMLGGAGESYTRVVGLKIREVKLRKAAWYPPDERGLRKMMEELGIWPDLIEK